MLMKLLRMRRSNSLSLIAITVVFSGCTRAYPTEAVVATWRGVLSEKQINKRDSTVTPIVDNIRWDASQGALLLGVAKKRTATVDIVVLHEKIQAVRTVSPGRAAYAVFVSEDRARRMSMPDQYEGVAKADKKNAELREESVRALKAGKKSVAVDYYVWWPPNAEEAGIRIRYVRSTAEDKETELLRDQEIRTMVKIPNVPVKIVGRDSGKAMTAEADSMGVATFILAKSYDESLRLKPDEYCVHIQLEGCWKEVGEVELTEIRIAEIVMSMKQKEME